MGKKEKAPKKGPSSSQAEANDDGEEPRSPVAPPPRPLAPAAPRQPSSPADGGQAFDSQFFSSNALAAQQAYEKAAATAGDKTNSNAGKRHRPAPPPPSLPPPRPPHFPTMGVKIDGFEGLFPLGPGCNEAYDSSYAMQARALANATATASVGNAQPEAQQPPTAPYTVQSEANTQQPSRPVYALPPPTRSQEETRLYATTDPRVYQNLSVAGNFPGFGRPGAPSSSQFRNDELYDLSDEEREAHRRRRQREREREGR